MRKYSKQEAILQKWKKSLLQIADSENKQSLLDIINSEKNAEQRYSEFNQKKETILQTKDDSILAWIWSFVIYLFWCCWPQNKSINLEELLLTEISVKEFGRMSGPSSEDGNAAFLEDTVFEEAIFNKPEDALDNIQRCINLLPRDSSKLKKIFERLEAIKSLLTAGCYQTLLAQLYKKYPLETLNYQYQLYIEESEKFVGPEEFLEYELMSRTLMDLFILPLDTDPINQRCFAIQELLVLLALSNQEKAPVATMLANAITNRTKTSELFKQLGPCYEETKSQIIEFIPGIRFQNSTTILEDLIQNNSQQTILSYQPIFLNLARLACQELLLNYHQYPQQQHSKVLHKTIEFLSSKILKTWFDAKTERQKTEQLMKERKTLQETIFSYEECCAILSIFSQTQTSEFNYQNAIFYSNQLVMASLSGTKDLLSKVNDFNSLKPHEKIWVLSVIERLQANEENLTKIDSIKNKQNFSSNADNPNRFSAKPLVIRPPQVMNLDNNPQNIPFI